MSPLGTKTREGKATKPRMLPTKIAVNRVGEKGCQKMAYRKGRRGVTQLLTCKKLQLYFRDEQTFILLQRIYFERMKLNKYISTNIALMKRKKKKKNK